MTLPRFLAAMALGSFLLGTPAHAQEAPEAVPAPAPPIVFDAQGHGIVLEPAAPAAPDPLRDLQYLPEQSQLDPVYGTPWWWRPAWEYDEAGLYLFGDPYAGRRDLETLNRVQWPGWCPP